MGTIQFQAPVQPPRNQMLRRFPDNDTFAFESVDKHGAIPLPVIMLAKGNARAESPGDGWAFVDAYNAGTFVFESIQDLEETQEEWDLWANFALNARGQLKVNGGTGVTPAGQPINKFASASAGVNGAAIIHDVTSAALSGLIIDWMTVSPARESIHTNIPFDMTNSFNMNSSTPAWGIVKLEHKYEHTLWLQINLAVNTVQFFNEEVISGITRIDPVAESSIIVSEPNALDLHLDAFVV